MADFAAGTWTLVDTENFDEYMKAIGVGMVMRKMAAQVKPTQIISVSGNDWSIQTKTTLKNTELAFTLGQEFDENTADGRNVKSCVTLEGKKLIHKQKGDPDCEITREWDEDNGFIMKLTAKGATCTRRYKRAA